MKLNNDSDISIQQFFNENFPLPPKIFNSSDELLDYYVKLENEFNNSLKKLIGKLLYVPSSKVKFAKNELSENLLLSFENNESSKQICKILKDFYRNTSEILMNNNKIIKEKSMFNSEYIKDQIDLYIDIFLEKVSREFNGRTIFPNFLITKFFNLIKNNYLNILSANNIDISDFDLSNNLIKVSFIYKEIFIYKTSYLFDRDNKNYCNSEFFELLLLSNNIVLKQDKKILARLLKDFNYFIYLFNLEQLYENKNYAELYNTNKLIEKYLNKCIKITNEEAIMQKAKIMKSILSQKSSSNKLNEKIINYILSYTLILNYLVTKNKKNGEVELSLTQKYNSFASMKILLNNTLDNFEIYLDVDEIKQYIQSSLIKNLFSLVKYHENLSYSIEEIKNLLLYSSKEKLKHYSVNFFKGLYTTKHNRLIDFLFSMDKDFKESNIEKIDLTPLNKNLISTHSYIFISGFLSEESDHFKEWENFTIDFNSRDTCYFYNWPGNTISKVASENIVNFGLLALNAIANANLSNSADEKIKKYQEANNKRYNNFYLGQPFIDSFNKAKLCGKLLALILASKLFFKHQTITFVGFSLGTQVTKYCLKQLYKLHYEENIPCNDIIENVILIAGATTLKDKEKKYKNIFGKMIRGKIVNCFSEKDSVLSVLYTNCMNKKPVGNSKLELDGFERLVNIDFTPFNLGHTDYRNKMDLVLNKIKLYE